MNKYVLLLLLVVIAVFYNIYAAHDHSNILRVGVECDHVPYNWEETSKTDSNFPLKGTTGLYVEGYDVQMAALIAHELDMKPEFHKVSFDELIHALNNGEIDAIFSGMVDTKERKDLINFSIPYEVSAIEYAVLVHKNSKYTKAKSLSDLAGARIAAQKDSRFDDVVDQIPSVIHLPPLDTQAAILAEISALRIDATVVNYDTALSYERNHPDMKAVRFARNKGFVLGFTGLCAGFRKSDTKLLNYINSAIRSISIRQRQRVMDRAIVNAFEHM